MSALIGSFGKNHTQARQFSYCQVNFFRLFCGSGSWLMFESRLTIRIDELSMLPWIYQAAETNSRVTIDGCKFAASSKTRKRMLVSAVGNSKSTIPLTCERPTLTFARNRLCEINSRDCKSKQRQFRSSLSRNSHTVSRVARVSEESSWCNLDRRSLSCRVQRKTVRVLCNTEHYV